jgi:hypothetical protein
VGLVKLTAPPAPGPGSSSGTKPQKVLLDQLRTGDETVDQMWSLFHGQDGLNEVDPTEAATC